MSPLWPGRGGPVIDYISAMPGRDYCEKKTRSVTILGSTGSIGINTLKVIDAGKGFFKVEALGAGRNVKLLAAQANRYEPACLAVQDAQLAGMLPNLLKPGYAPHILWGEEGYARIAALDNVDCVVSAQSGSAGLCGTISACLAAKVICLANKESLVIAGGLARNICHATGAAILPVDSEHNALFQCLAAHGQNAQTLILTASGGPFRGKTFAETRNMEAADALRHPNWSMGAKVTIDSATMMNKGLELIEAMHLYGVGADNIEILVHPQSIVHSLVRFADNSLLAQLAVPDMRLPIADSMFWPRLPQQPVPFLDLTACGPLTFEKPALEDFPCLKLARQAACYQATGPWLANGLNPACIVLNAANEEAVALFLKGQCQFGDIPAMVAAALANLASPENLQCPEISEARPGDWEYAVLLVKGIQALSSLAKSAARQWLEGQRSETLT